MKAKLEWPPFEPQSTNGRLPRYHQWLLRSRPMQNREIADCGRLRGRMSRNCKTLVKAYEITTRIAVRRQCPTPRVQRQLLPKDPAWCKGQKTTVRQFSRVGNFGCPGKGARKTWSGGVFAGGLARLPFEMRR